MFRAAEIGPNQASFRSVEFPDRFIRHRDSMLFADPVATPSELRSARFGIAAPLHPEEFQERLDSLLIRMPEPPLDAFHGGSAR
ncbi:hypothetical protein [Streptomyces litmocidini]|uniref:hypothetical protein n=1 Tax=Streptomyces litmocidini TaxID=67318 RepID=UPI003700E9E3